MRILRYLPAVGLLITVVACGGPDQPDAAGTGGAAGRGDVAVNKDAYPVFPDADVKIYLVADPWERAKRRLVQHLKRLPTDEEIAAETDRLVHRDAADTTQLVQARDAVLIDTTHLLQAEQVARIVALAKAATRSKE